MKANKKDGLIVVLIITALLLLSAFITGCRINSADSKNSGLSGGLDQAGDKQAEYKKTTVLKRATPSRAGETTVTVDGIVVKITVHAGGTSKRGYPEQLPLLMATDKALDKNQVLNWFSPLKAVPDAGAKISLFYPVGSRFYLVDSKGVKRGKLLIDRFGAIYYERIGKDGGTIPDQFTFAQGINLVKRFLDSHKGSKPSGSFFEQTGVYREKEDMPPDGRHITKLLRWFHHDFNSVFIQDDDIEVSVSKNFEAFYFRRWHDFKTYGVDQALLTPEELAGLIVQKYKPMWKKQRAVVFKQLLSGKKPLSIELTRLVYYDPRPRDPEQFNNEDVICRPGWVVKVGAVLGRKPSEDTVNGIAIRGLPSGDELAYIKVPTLIVDAASGAIYRSKPTGDGLYFRQY